MPAHDEPGWILTFQDEFDAPDLDMSKWNTYYRDAQAHYVRVYRRR